MATTDRLNANAVSATDRRTVIGVFDGPNHAEQALSALRDSGFTPEQVSVVAKDRGDTRAVVEHTGMGAESTGAGTGAVLGGITGGVLGWLVGIGALVIPGVGPIIAAGALATTLGGAAIGALAGGLIGALVGLGVPEEEAHTYEERVKAGSILLLVHANSDSQIAMAHDIFDRHGGADVRAYGDTGMYTAASAAGTGGSIAKRDDGKKEMGGGAVTGAATGAVAGAAIGGPPGAVIGGVAGGAGGAAVGKGVHEVRPADHRDKAGEGGAGGALAGGTAGALIGTAVAPGPGTVAGAAIGGAAGAASGATAGAAAHDDGSATTGRTSR